jgi:hypothetical protein
MGDSKFMGQCSLGCISVYHNLAWLINSWYIFGNWRWIDCLTTQCNFSWPTNSYEDISCGWYNKSYYKYLRGHFGCFSKMTSVVCVNGLELTLCVNINPIMKLIYTLCKCKCKNKYIYIVLRGPIKQGKCKNTYIHMILHGYVKQCECITM